MGLIEYITINPYLITFLCFIPVLYFIKQYFDGPQCTLVKDYSEKIVIITGANDGIGKETARCLAYMRARVIFACRNSKKSLEVIQEIKKESKNENIEFIHLDLSNFDSIKMFVEKFKKKFKHLDILINNAGIVTNQYKKTEDGLEETFQVNYMGHFLLTNMLLDYLITTPESRVINVSSKLHFESKQLDLERINEKDQFIVKGFNYQPYNKSKLAQVLFTKELQRRVKQIKNATVKVVALHPGVVRTNFQNTLKNDLFFSTVMLLISPFWYFFTKDSYQGAQTSLYCALEDWSKLVDGGYYSDCKLKNPSPLAESLDDATELWNFSNNQVGFI